MFFLGRPSLGVWIIDEGSSALCDHALVRNGRHVFYDGTSHPRIRLITKRTTAMESYSWMMNDGGWEDGGEG